MFHVSSSLFWLLLFLSPLLFQVGICGYVCTCDETLFQCSLSVCRSVGRSIDRSVSLPVSGGSAEEIRIPMSVGICGYVCTHAETLNVPNVDKDPRFNVSVDLQTGYRTRSILCAPLKDENGVVIGVCSCVNKGGATKGTMMMILHAFFLCLHLFLFFIPLPPLSIRLICVIENEKTEVVIVCSPSFLLSFHLPILFFDCLLFLIWSCSIIHRSRRLGAFLSFLPAFPSFFLPLIASLLSRSCSINHSLPHPLLVLSSLFPVFFFLHLPGCLVFRSCSVIHCGR